MRVQIGVDESGSEKTRSITLHAIYQWQVMPLVLCCAAAAFQRFIENGLAASTYTGILNPWTTQFSLPRISMRTFMLLTQ